MFYKLRQHIERWNIWRKRSINGPGYKFLVLIGLVKSPTMACVYTNDELADLYKSIENF